MPGQELEGIKVEREGSNAEVGHVGGKESDLMTRTRNRRGPSSLDDTAENVASTPDPVGEPNNMNNAGLQPTDGPRKNARSTDEDLRARFYERYRKEAEEYDKEFVKRHDEDLNTTLIFAGLFSAVTSAFIIQVHPLLQPDPNDDTNALLRVLIQKIDNTTFGDNVPALPQWTGPPRMAIQVQCMLYASLAASLFSAFLAMLGKQWLNRYASIDMRGSAIERSQDRQRKLDGIVAWYFDHVLESLPVMLQLALLLLGCALSRYLWDIDTTIASVVLGVTSFGVLFYLFIVIAGAVAESCPYQTPWTNVIRNVAHHVPTIPRLAYVFFIKRSRLYRWAPNWRDETSATLIIFLIIIYPFFLLVVLTMDTLRLGRATFRIFITFTRGTRNWPFGKRTTGLDGRCISWMLQTSLDKTVNLLTLRFLETIIGLPGPDSTLIVDCFDFIISCIVIDDRGAAEVTRGSEQLAQASITCFLFAFTRVLSTESQSSAVRDVRQRYKRVFPSHVKLWDVPCPIVINLIHHLFTERWRRPFLDWKNYSLSIDELVPFAHALAQVAQIEYCRREDEPKVPRWLLRFALHFLSQDPPPPTSVVTDCLTIIATDLGCNVSDTDSVASDESTRLEQLFTSMIEKYETIAPEDLLLDENKAKATIAFLPYAVRREVNGAALSLISRWIFKPTAQLLEVVLPISLKYATLGAFQYGRMFLGHASDVSTMMQLWIGAASVLPYTDDVGRSVVGALLEMASSDQLSPHIPVLAWYWLNKRPTLHLRQPRRIVWITESAVQTVRGLKDVGLMVSFLFILWSGWNGSSSAGGSAIVRLIGEELGGIGLAGCRADLIQRLDYFLSRPDREWEDIYLSDFLISGSRLLSLTESYERFRRELLEVDEEATKILTGSHFTFMCALPLPCP